MAVKPNGVPGVILGVYRFGVRTGLTTGLGANDTLFAFRWGDTTRRAMIQLLRVQAQVITPFTAAQEVGVEAFVARSFSVSDSGGTAITLTTPNQKISSVNNIASLVTDARVAAAATLTPGTRTLDAQPIAQALGAQILAAAGAAFTPSIAVYEAVTDSRFPIILTTNEGLIVRSPIAQGAGGTVRYSIELEWLEFMVDPS